MISVETDSLSQCEICDAGYHLNDVKNSYQPSTVCKVSTTDIYSPTKTGVCLIPEEDKRRNVGLNQRLFLNTGTLYLTHFNKYPKRHYQRHEVKFWPLKNYEEIDLTLYACRADVYNDVNTKATSSCFTEGKPCPCLKIDLKQGTLTNLLDQRIWDFPKLTSNDIHEQDNFVFWLEYNNFRRKWIIRIVISIKGTNISEI